MLPYCQYRTCARRNAGSLLLSGPHTGEAGGIQPPGAGAGGKPGQAAGNRSGQPQNDDAPMWKIVEDIGEVRHTKAIPNGQLIAIELIGLGDSDIGELIQAANTASLELFTEGQDISVSSPVGEPHQESNVV